MDLRLTLAKSRALLDWTAGGRPSPHKQLQNLDSRGGCRYVSVLALTLPLRQQVGFGTINCILIWLWISVICTEFVS